MISSAVAIQQFIVFISKSVANYKINVNNLYGLASTDTCICDIEMACTKTASSDLLGAHTLSNKF